MKKEKYSKKVKKTKANKANKKSFVFRFALVAFSVYTVYNFVQLQVLTEKKQNNIDKLKEEVQQIQAANDELQDQRNNYELYLEKKAREQGYARPDERVYIGSPGN